MLNPQMLQIWKVVCDTKSLKIPGQVYRDWDTKGWDSGIDVPSSYWGYQGRCLESLRWISNRGRERSSFRRVDWKSADWSNLKHGLANQKAGLKTKLINQEVKKKKKIDHNCTVNDNQWIVEGTTIGNTAMEWDGCYVHIATECGYQYILARWYKLNIRV